jgi:Sulphur transport
MQTCGSDSAVLAAPVCGVSGLDLALAAMVAAGAAGTIWYLARRTSLRPYLAGGGLGLLFAISETAFGRTVGISGAFQQRAVTWPVLVAAGVFAGGLISSTLSGRWRVTTAPIGTRHRWLSVFFLAMVLEISAAIAGGCTSGLALSGGMVLAPGAFVFMAAMFAAGVLVRR